MLGAPPHDHPTPSMFPVDAQSLAQSTVHIVTSLDRARIWTAALQDSDREVYCKMNRLNLSRIVDNGIMNLWPAMTIGTMLAKEEELSQSRSRRMVPALHRATSSRPLILKSIKIHIMLFAKLIVSHSVLPARYCNEKGDRDITRWLQ